TPASAALARDSSPYRSANRRTSALASVVAAAASRPCLIAPDGFFAGWTVRAPDDDLVILGAAPDNDLIVVAPPDDHFVVVGAGDVIARGRDGAATASDCPGDLAIVAAARVSPHDIARRALTPVDRAARGICARGLPVVSASAEDAP